MPTTGYLKQTKCTKEEFLYLYNLEHYSQELQRYYGIPKETAQKLIRKIHFI